MQFWRDNINRIFANAPPKEPVAILLHNAIVSLQERHPNASTAVMKGWFMKIISARETYMDNRPYTTLDALENYAENTYSTLMYLTLASLPLHSLPLDHLASHIGKATGITTVLRGLPLIAFPSPPNHHSNKAALGGDISINPSGRHGAVLLPLDVMAEAGVKEEEVLRQGATATGLKDAVFRVATRANDHLITVAEMLKNLRQGKAAGHDFEHEGEDGHNYAEPSTNGHTQAEVDRGFGILMQAVPTRLWLQRLEQADFDIFKPELLAREWKLPWRAYWAYRRKQI
jgi:NADH dehydrogenase [ubiquinone] 1 alpha subcomplex assembly factor 6